MATARPRSALIVTADDFGLHERVNEAVMRAHREGVLTSASLMVSAPAAADAVARARRMPSLRVGLHIVIADGVATLGHAQVPALTDASGRFGDRLVYDGFRYFFQAPVRAQLAAEIRAQFDAFRATGLPLDHVNTHKHLHLHPTVMSLIVRIGREYGMKAMRLPFEASAPLWLKPWMMLLRSRLKRAGIVHNDYVVGIAQSGHMDERAWLEALDELPDGIGEIYSHPAVAGAAPLTLTMSDYRHADELDALLSERVAAALRTAGIARGGYTDVFADAFNGTTTSGAHA
jgi:chitin disaccharide deacetylase